MRLYSVSGPAFRLRSLQNADMVNNPAKKVLRLLGEDGKQLCSGTRYLPFGADADPAGVEQELSGGARDRLGRREVRSAGMHIVREQS